MSNLVFMSFYTYKGLWARCPELGLRGKSLNAVVVSVDIFSEHAHFLTASPTQCVVKLGFGHLVKYSIAILF